MGCHLFDCRVNNVPDSHCAQSEPNAFAEKAAALLKSQDEAIEAKFKEIKAKK